jgi:hypothetical protein
MVIIMDTPSLKENFAGILERMMKPFVMNQN